MSASLPTTSDNRSAEGVPLDFRESNSVNTSTGRPSILKRKLERPVRDGAKDTVKVAVKNVAKDGAQDGSKVVPATRRKYPDDFNAKILAQMIPIASSLLIDDDLMLARGLVPDPGLMKIAQLKEVRSSVESKPNGKKKSLLRPTKKQRKNASNVSEAFYTAFLSKDPEHPQTTQTSTSNTPHFKQTSLLHPPVSTNAESKSGTIVKHVLVNESDPNQESIMQGFILNSKEKNLVLVPTSTPTSTNTVSLPTSLPPNAFLLPKSSVAEFILPKNTIVNGNEASAKVSNMLVVPDNSVTEYLIPKNGSVNVNEAPIQSLIMTAPLSTLANVSNVTTFTISKGGIKAKQDPPPGSGPSRPKIKGGSIRLPVGSLQGKVLQCTSTAVSINSTTCSPKQLSAPKSIVSSPNVLLSLASQKQALSPNVAQNQSIVRRALKNGKLGSDMNVPIAPVVKPIPIAPAPAEVPKPPLKPIQSQQQSVTLSAPKQQMNWSTIPAIVPVNNDAKFKALNTKTGSLKDGSSTDQQQSTDANQESSDASLANDNASSVPCKGATPRPAPFASNIPIVTSSVSIAVEIATTTHASLGTSGCSAGKTATAHGPPGLLPFAMLSSDTTTTSTILSAISSSVPLLQTPDSTGKQTNEASKASGSLLVIPNVAQSSLPSLILHANGAYVTSRPSTTSSSSTTTDTLSDMRVPSEILEAIASLSSIPVPVPEVPQKCVPILPKHVPLLPKPASLSSPSRQEESRDSTGGSIQEPGSVRESKEGGVGELREVGLPILEGEIQDGGKKSNVIPMMGFNPNGSQEEVAKLLDWTDVGVGALAGSSIKFKVNEFGMMEIDDNFDKRSDSGSDTISVKDESLDDDSTNKENFSDFLLCKENVLDESLETKENRNSNSSLKKHKRKEARREIRVDDNDADCVFQEKFDEMYNEKVKGMKKGKVEPGDSRKSALKNKEEAPKEEILQCEGCNCYGLSNEFFNERACCSDCERDVKQKLAIAKKQECDLNNIRWKKKEKYYSLLKKEIKERKLHARDEIKSKIELIEKVDIDKIDLAKLEEEIKALGVTEFNDDERMDCGEDMEPAPSELFKSLEKSDPNKPDPIHNPFKMGMKLEGIDPQHQSNFCAMTVAEVRGHRLRLHFDGFNECHDFWVNSNSPDIFPVGWCESKKRKLNPPFGYSEEAFNWQSYLKQCRAKAAPTSFFRSPPSKVNNQFKKGMKLEAVDRKNSTLTCVATVADTIDNRILVHFDSWGDVYDYWTDITAPYIHPVGWCQEQNCDLTPPTNYKSNQVFVWDEYLKDTKSKPVPASAFDPSRNRFKVNMKLEAVDFRVPKLIRPATIIEIKEHRLKVAYDGFPLRYAFWMDCDNPFIYPVGWCDKTRHPMEPLPSMDSLGECGTRGCTGVGHVKGPKFLRHFTQEQCPYSKQNLDPDAVEHIPDRLLPEVDVYEAEEPISKPSVVKKELLEPDVEPIEPSESEQVEISNSDKPSEKPIKQTSDTSSNSASTSKAREHLRRRGRKKRISTEMEAPKPKVTPKEIEAPAVKIRRSSKDIEAPRTENFDLLRQDVIESVLRPGYTPSSIDSRAWTKHASLLGINVIEAADPRKWTHKQVTAFVTRLYNQPDKTRIFSEQEIDGEAFLMLTQKDLVDILGLKLGPAIKIFNSIVLLRQKIS